MSLARPFRRLIRCPGSEITVIDENSGMVEGVVHVPARAKDEFEIADLR